ncbi:aconitase X swivel domain-containing protein [Nitrosopumilus sp.]|uniref:aconitase X swivel domain-containing protein n=1 Tax=Nitrosopumilus sp. TaxID=2024843 RepID=UPI003D10CA53
MKVLVSGKVEGTVLKSKDAINFLGTVDKKTGIISDKNHDLYEKSIKDTILVFPSGVGSSVGAYTIYSIKSNGTAPLAMICQKADLTVATGCALANIPLVILPDEEFSSINNGMKLSLDTDSTHPLQYQ